jgi:pyruvate-formate lyase-activating enzyme
MNRTSSDEQLDHEGLLAREAIAREEHRWVRLTRACNNRCAFCLDAEVLDGSHIAPAQVEAQILEGRRRGATRLILSGGEPTIHPQFADFIRCGRVAGYRKVQTITNGRMFSYPAFLERALNAGLNEITFSVHGPDALTHDALVGVPGAFAQQRLALTAALADGRAVVNVDVCLNRRNIDCLPQILDYCLALGVREFDLLHIIPFGRAFAGGDDSLAYDIDAAMPAIRYALELARRPDLHIWFNRFPPSYLEGHEHLIQDPSKLLDEVWGRISELTRWMSTGVPMPCRTQARCRRCNLQGYCDFLATTHGRFSRGELDVLRVDARLPWAVPPGQFAIAWVRAADVAAALDVIPHLPGDELFLQLDRFDGLTARIADRLVAGKRLRRVYVARPSDLSDLVAIADLEVVAVLSGAMTTWLMQTPAIWPQLSLVAPSHATAAAAQADRELLGFFTGRAFPGSVAGLPACITGQLPRAPELVLDADIVGADGHFDPVALARRFVSEDYTIKSRRCRACIHDATCAGAHINLVRVAGFRVLRPLSP